MSHGELIVVGVAILVASFVQIIAGFGFALLCFIAEWGLRRMPGLP